MNNYSIAAPYPVQVAATGISPPISQLDFNLRLDIDCCGLVPIAHP